MTGAGISVSAGIPDFRSPETGIYARIETLTGIQLPYPEALFDKRFFIKNPQVYYTYRKERLRDKDEAQKVHPTPSHYFIKLLCAKGLVHKVFTQNTDGLHLKSGLTEEEVVHAHGIHGHAVCPVCGTRDSYEKMMEGFSRAEVGWGRNGLSEGKQSPIKPGVVFFSESLPKEFHEAVRKPALQGVDLLMIFGTSLRVKPFSLLTRLVPEHCPQVLINRGNADVDQGESYS